jgi:uncharacterized membrane protein YgcG
MSSMSRRAAGVLLLIGLMCLWHQPAAASKLVALVIGNESPDNGLSRADLNSKLSELKSSLFKYGSETHIIEGMNLSREDLLERMRKFEAGLAEAEVAFFYYAGVGAHNPDGNSYLVPQGWDGRQEAELVAIGSLLERMRGNPNSRGLVFLDALKPKTASGWQPTILPGLGSLSKEADQGKLQIAFLEMMPGPAGAGGILTRALLRQLQPERIKLPQFASLVQEDVSFDTGSIHVPRLFGSVDGSLELQRLSKDELAAKQQKCLANRESNSFGEPMGLGARPKEASRSRAWFWYCPEPPPPLSAAPAPEPRRQAKPDRKVPVAEKPSAPRRAYVRSEGGRPSYRGGGGGGGYGGGGGSAAASSVPTP